MLQIYLYTHRSEEAKRKQIEQRRSQRKRSLDENAVYGPPDKGLYIYFNNEITPGQKKRKEKVTLQKSYLYRINNGMGQKKYLLLVLQ